MDQISKKIQQIHNYSEEIIHDISYDWYGNRLAMCFSNNKVVIKTKQEDEKWQLTASFQAHDGPVWRVKWALPEFGNLLATCSHDKSIKVWEEKRQQAVNQKAESQMNWSMKVRLFDSNESAEDIKFAPRYKELQQGLVLAAAYADGMVRIWEAPDLMNLGQWNKMGDIAVSNNGINTISWSKGFFGPPMLAVGCKDASQGYQKSVENISIVQPLQDGQLEKRQKPLLQEFHFFIYGKFKNEWREMLRLPDKQQGLDYMKQGVNDISWCQINGRSYHMIAVAGKEGVKVLYLNYDSQEQSLKIKKISNIVSNTEFWRATWNVMGTLLASSDCNNTISVWRSAAIDEWVCVSKMGEKENHEHGEDEEQLPNN